MFTIIFQQQSGKALSPEDARDAEKFQRMADLVVSDAETHVLPAIKRDLQTLKAAIDAYAKALAAYQVIEGQLPSPFDPESGAQSREDRLAIAKQTVARAEEALVEAMTDSVQAVGQWISKMRDANHFQQLVNRIYQGLWLIDPPKRFP